MRIPGQLEEAIQGRLETIAGEELQRASRRMSEAYRSDGRAGMRTQAERIAYLAVRLPATYASVIAVLRETQNTIPGFEPKSLLDLGAGPGTALWAAAEVYPSLERINAVERDGDVGKIGRALAESALSPALRAAKWHSGDIRSWRTADKYDLVIASYSLGELTAGERKDAVSRAWDACSGALAVVEPGTKRGFESILEIRRQLLQSGSWLAAPCPHALECPMKAAGDWCHFSIRVERSAEHRRLKQGELGYEDEKFSYVVSSKLPVAPSAARVVRHPMRYSGYTRLQLCTPEGLREQTVTRSQKELYRKAKKTDWGAGWE